MLAWEPPHRLLLDWQIGEAPAPRSRCASRRKGPGSRVELEHRGWERVPTRPARVATTSGWDVVLGAVRRERVEEGLKPAQPLRPRHRGVRGRGRGEHEERRLAEAALLRPELRPLAERAAVGLLADEADRARLELERDPLQPLGRAGEVALAQVAGAGRRAVGGVGDADPELEQLELLARVVAAAA